MKKAWVLVVVAMLATPLLCVSSLAEREGSKIRLVTREVSLGKIHPGIVPRTFVVSADGRRVAYAAWRADKCLVVVDGAEGKEYDVIGEGDPIFSPDGKRVAYAARRGQKWLVVVEAVEGKEYDAFLRGSELMFDSPKLLHALAHREKEFFRVEIEIVQE